MQEPKKQASLAFVVTVYTALVIAGGMAAYAVYEYVAMPDRTVLGLALEHGWHVAALGVLIYGALAVVLYRHVVRPLQELDVKLYAISKVDFTPIEVNTRIKEIQQIATVTNFLLRRMTQAGPDDTAQHLAADSQTLRALATDEEALPEAARVKLMDVAADVDQVAELLSVDRLGNDGELVGTDF